MLFRSTAMTTLTTLGVLSIAQSALAHTGHDAHAAGGFAAGFLHPITGIDHLLAMVAVGLLAVRAGGRAVLTIPAAFVGMMFVGGLLAMAGVAHGSPVVEWGIALSVLVFGLMVAAMPKVNTRAGAIVVGVFALFHGHAHIAEMAAGSTAAYQAGMLIGTALLHAVGVIVGLALMNARRDTWLRAAGGAVAACFFLLVTGII